MRSLCLGMGALALVGCAQLQPPPPPQPEMTWNHPTNTEQQFYADNSACMAMSSGVAPKQVAPASGAPADLSYAATWNQLAMQDARQKEQDIYYQCMFGKGYKYVPVSSVTPLPH